MIIAKPIDWTRPLRTIYDRRPARVVSIDPTDSLPVLIEIATLPGSTDDLSLSLRVDRGGCGRPSKLFDVENVPAEPTIIERWMLIGRPANGVYLSIGNSLRSSRDGIEKDRAEFTRGKELLVAHVLIEETGE